MADTEIVGEKTYGTILPQKEYTWEERVRSLRDIANHGGSLPICLKWCAIAGDISKYLGCRDSKGLADVVLKISELRRKKIILAKKLEWDKTTMDYIVTGEQIEIPSFYKVHINDKSM
ncbi:hypothetical protein LOTGIDRAFT_157448 [Lottia gigantea]|uniref:Uncharacterized protein n=1 Tax=Lottia gigantea TaxID=225164 RepID=V4B5J0_LOTGI|nr:hypothetical protein LOTGIDRAFT_157448 [Lottia gigantea]ESP01272.1 hypothetical protein LOTGIDRAFT_157448 [Lottia gigantea]